MTAEEQRAKEVYELMDNKQLRELKSAFKRDLRYNITTESGTLFAHRRIFIINKILRERR